MKCKYETTSWYEGMKRCLGTKEVDPCPGYEKCQHFKPYRMTNADRIRAMTDEELAEREVRCAIEFFENGQSGYYKRVWKTSDGAIFADKQLASEYELQWLKQPYGGAEG